MWHYVASLQDGGSITQNGFRRNPSCGTAQKMVLKAATGMRTDLDEKYELLRHLLIEARGEAGLKQADVAEKLGRPQSYISKIERGERKVDVVEFLEIASAIGFDPLPIIKVLKFEQ